MASKKKKPRKVLNRQGKLVVPASMKVKPKKDKRGIFVKKRDKQIQDILDENNPNFE